MQRLLSDRKTDSTIIKHFHSSTNPDNLVKIGPVVSEITRLICRPLKLKNKQKHQKSYSSPGMLLLLLW